LATRHDEVVTNQVDGRRQRSVGTCSTAVVRLGRADTILLTGRAFAAAGRDRPRHLKPCIHVADEPQDARRGDTRRRGSTADGDARRNLSLRGDGDRRHGTWAGACTDKQAKCVRGCARQSTSSNGQRSQRRSPIVASIQATASDGVHTAGPRRSARPCEGKSSVGAVGVIRRAAIEK